MKAFMSDERARIQGEADSILTTRVQTHDERVSGYATLAVIEARAILAETEPCAVRCSQVEPMAAWPNRTVPADPRVFSALAEALSSFIGEGH